MCQLLANSPQKFDKNKKKQMKDATNEKRATNIEKYTEDFHELVKALQLQSRTVSHAATNLEAFDDTV